MKKEWTRTPGASGGSCGARWLHTSGAIVLHCGHPTALWPYYAFKANGDRVFIKVGKKDCGCFTHLKDAQEEALA